MNKEFMIPEPSVRHEYDSFSSHYEARKEAEGTLPYDAKLTLIRFHLRKALAIGANHAVATEVIKALTKVEELCDAPHTK